ncbi:unnamed protein product [Durusdinium trenchii]|uniref:Serine protease n=1 Tax=Durusdinium trenchii TaxID=1381693 RepID=A0ABP0STP3_9DINO
MQENIVIPDSSESCNAVCIIEIDADGAVGTGFLGVFPALLPGLLFLVTCHHVIPDEAACASAICTFEADAQPSASILLEPHLGFWTSKVLDVAVIRIASFAAFTLPRLKPHVLDLDGEPAIGEAVWLSCFSRQKLAHFCGRSLGTNGKQLRVEVQDTLPEKGASGGPVTACGQAVAVHVGLFRQTSGVEARASLLSALNDEAHSGTLSGALRPKQPLPSQLTIHGRRGTNDIINGVYQVCEDKECGQNIWVRISPDQYEATMQARPSGLILYKGSRSQAWTVATRLGDGLLRSEGGLGGILARRLKLEDGDDPTEVCVGDVANWHVASGAAGKLQPDPLVRLMPLADADFAKLRTSWRSLAASARTRLANAVQEVEVTGFPGSMSLLNGKLCLLPEPWNWYPAWRSKEAKVGTDHVFLYRDASQTKWVIGLALGNGHERMAHVCLAREAACFILMCLKFPTSPLLSILTRW